MTGRSKERKLIRVKRTISFIKYERSKGHNVINFLYTVHIVPDTLTFYSKYYYNYFLNVLQPFIQLFFFCIAL